MIDKYYTPSIEEFHVGFEFEAKNSSHETNFEWEKVVVINCDSVTFGGSDHDYDIYDFRCGVNEGMVRVKYLDQSDIESFGFKIGKLPYQYFKDNYMLVDLDNNKYSITDLKDDQCLFYGIIKNKSELKVLLKQLGICE